MLTPGRGRVALTEAGGRANLDLALDGRLQ